jgi:hypothetical protein
MAVWTKSLYSDVYYNIGGTAEAHLPETMLREIKADHRITIPLRDRLFSYSDHLRNLVRNLGGMIALLTMWFLPFMRERRFAICLAAFIFPYFVFGASLGYGPGVRYEVAVQPLILLLAATGVMGVLALVQRYLPKTGRA